jgi:hypothetical protein
MASLQGKQQRARRGANLVNARVLSLLVLVLFALNSTEGPCVLVRVSCCGGLIFAALQPFVFSIVCIVLVLLWSMALFRSIPSF